MDSQTKQQGDGLRDSEQADPGHGGIRAGSVSNVDITTPMPLIYKTLFSSISTFETPPEMDAIKHHRFKPAISIV
jgi:hypothetical protein